MSAFDNIRLRDDFTQAGQFHWFTGVIEDIVDPEQRGRYRVRCFGYHTEKKDYIPTTMLPWAHVMMPITSGAQCGVGESATGLLRGTWVVGFFRDGQVAQDPVIMGTLPSVASKVNYQYGFSDPVKQYPYADKVDQQDIPEEAISKNDKYKESFSYKKKVEHRSLTPVSIAFGGVWNLPPVESIVRVVYPKNHVKAWERVVPLQPVIESPISTTGILDSNCEKAEGPEFFKVAAGIEPEKKMHVQEFDVTPGYERISTMHSSGTYKEWTPKGDDTTVIVGDEYRIIIKNQMINIKGDCSITVDGNLHTLVKGDEYRMVNGNMIETIMGSYTKTVVGNVNKSYVMNEMKTVGLNKTTTVSLNQMSTTLLNNATFTGQVNHRMSILNDELVTLNKKVQTAASDAEEYVLGKVKTFNLGMREIFTGNEKKEFTLLNEKITVGIDSTHNTIGSHTGQCGVAMTMVGAATATYGATGPCDQAGAITTMNGSFPVHAT